MDARAQNSVGCCSAISQEYSIRYLNFAKEEGKQGTIVPRLCGGSAVNVHNHEQGNLSRSEEFEKVS